MRKNRLVLTKKCSFSSLVYACSPRACTYAYLLVRESRRPARSTSNPSEARSCYHRQCQSDHREQESKTHSTAKPAQTTTKNKMGAKATTTPTSEQVTEAKKNVREENVPKEDPARTLLLKSALSTAKGADKLSFPDAPFTLSDSTNRPVSATECSEVVKTVSAAKSYLSKFPLRLSLSKLYSPVATLPPQNVLLADLLSCIAVPLTKAEKKDQTIACITKETLFDRSIQFLKFVENFQSTQPIAKVLAEKREAGKALD